MQVDFHKQDCNLYFALTFSVAVSSSTYISNSQFAPITVVISESSTGRSSSRAETPIPFHIYFHLGKIILNYFFPTHSVAVVLWRGNSPVNRQPLTAPHHLMWHQAVHPRAEEHHPTKGAPSLALGLGIPHSAWAIQFLLLLIAG